VLGTSFLGALLFLGAWSGPGPSGSGRLVPDQSAVIFLLITWVRWSFIRIRVDQILQISWKLLLPLTVLLVMATASRSW
jgi:NADH-quinone oxidoreductase subunit H